VGSRLRWVVRHRAWTRYHLVRYLRYAVFRLRHPGVVCEGMVFLGRGVRVTVRRGYGRLVLGSLTHIGDGCRLRVHEGTVRLGPKVVLGSDVTVTGYLDIEIGSATIVADWVYVTDFDHKTADPDVPIKDQGIVKAPVRIGPGCWLGAKSSVLRGTRLGSGSVLAAHAVARGDYPSRSLVAGVPGRVVHRLPGTS